MKLATSRAYSALVLILASGWLTDAASAVPVSVDLASLRVIQPYSLDKAAQDSAYLLVNGIASGKEFSEQIPKDKPWAIAPKQPVDGTKSPLTLWKGDLADGEFAVVTVTLLQGKADAANIKEYLDKKAEVEKKVSERSKPKLTQTDFENVASQTLKGQQGYIKEIKKLLSRDQNTDHFGGLINLVIWNNAGKIVKHLDPIGLTFGEHYGIDVKIYTKIKLTRANVMMKDDATGEWAEQDLTPLSEDQSVLRVKMLETEAIKGADGKAAKHVTDYLAEITIKADGKPLKWEIGGGDQGGPSELHKYWDFAE